MKKSAWLLVLLMPPGAAMAQVSNQPDAIRDVAATQAKYHYKLSIDRTEESSEPHHVDVYVNDWELLYYRKSDGGGTDTEDRAVRKIGIRLYDGERFDPGNEEKFKTVAITIDGSGKLIIYDQVKKEAALILG